MKVYSRALEGQVVVNFVTSREPSEFEMNVIDIETNSERTIMLRQVKGQANLFILDDYGFQYKIKTNLLASMGNDTKHRMFQVLPANQDTMTRMDTLFLNERTIVTGFSYKELEIEEKFKTEE